MPLLLAGPGVTDVSPPPVIVREITYDTQEIVWEVRTPVNHSSYRSERFEPYYGHVMD